MEIERKYRIDRFPGEEEGWPLVKEAVVCQGLHRHVADGADPGGGGPPPGEENHVHPYLQGGGNPGAAGNRTAARGGDLFAASGALPAPMIRKDYRVYALPTATGWSAAW